MSSSSVAFPEPALVGMAEAEIEARPTISCPNAPTRLGDDETLHTRQAPTRFRHGDLVPGTRYRIRRWVGWGGMGSVFEAVNEDTERRVALKILHEQYVTRAEVARGFRNEARVTGRLEAQDIRSENIVEVYDFKALADGRAVIAMEFLDGRDLYEETRNGPLPLPRVVAIGRQIARGLGAAHRAGIIHHDLKPANVMLVRRDGRPDFVKVLDFGVARLLADESTARPGGTPMYLAPEALHRGGDHAVDVYALGCVLFELAVGEPPYDGDNAQMLEQHRDARVPVPSARSKTPIPASFDQLIARCMAKKPEERFQSMAELEATLCEIQIEQGWKTPWDDLSPPDVEPERKARIAAALLPRQAASRSMRMPMVLAVAGLVTAVGIITWASLPERHGTGEVVIDRVDALSQAARDAAARAYFVYPPLDDAQGSTSFREVLALESLGTSAASRRGQELRREFADTLTRLGDKYWQFEEARTFSHEYYAMAALFVPSGRALERAGVTPTALDRLRQKAAEGTFSEYELASVLPLAALAEDNDQLRNEKLLAMRRQSLSPRASAELDRLLQAVAPAVAPGDGDAAASERFATGTAAVQAPPEIEDVAGPAPETSGGSLPPEPETESHAPRSEAELEGWMAAAAKAQRAGRAREAEALYHRVLGVQPRHVEATDHLGNLYFSAARYAECLSLRKRSVKLRPQSAERWLALGDAHFKTYDLASARQAYVRAQELGHTAAVARIKKVDDKFGW